MSKPTAQSALLWFGLAGAPFAWAAHFLVGHGLEEAACSAGSSQWGIDAGAFEVANTVAALAIAVAAGLGALVAWRRAGHAEDPRGRASFLAVSGLLASALFLGLILLGGIGAMTLDPCVES